MLINCFLIVSLLMSEVWIFLCIFLILKKFIENLMLTINLFNLKQIGGGGGLKIMFSNEKMWMLLQRNGVV